MRQESSRIGHAMPCCVRELPTRAFVGPHAGLQISPLLRCLCGQRCQLTRICSRACACCAARNCCICCSLSAMLDAIVLLRVGVGTERRRRAKQSKAKEDRKASKRQQAEKGKAKAKAAAGQGTANESDEGSRWEGAAPTGVRPFRLPAGTRRALLGCARGSRLGRSATSMRAAQRR